MAKLLIIADRDTRCVAIQRGLELARKLQCSVDVAAFCYTSLRPLKLKASERTTVKKRLLAERESEVRQRVDQFKDDGQTINLVTVWEKDVAAWVNRRCSRPYEVVVKTGHRSESFAYTSTDWQLLRECPRPVLIVAEKKWHHTKPVLATIDLASKVPEKIALNHAVIKQAKMYAAALGTEMFIITAIEVPSLLADLDLVDPIAYVNEIKSELKPRLREMAEAHDLPESIFRVKKGPIDKVIRSDAAKVRAQLVVVGTVGRRGVTARLLGNTAESVLRHLRTDVLAIKV